MCTKKLLLGLFLLVTILAFAACNVGIIKGSGDLITETRQVSNFDSIELSGSGEVIVTQGGSESLSIETDDNVMKNLKTEVVGGTLTLGFKEGVNLIRPTKLTFYVGVDDLNDLTISGSGDIEADMLETDRLNVNVSGSGNIQVADITTDEVNAEISGSGEIDLDGDAVAQKISVSGSGKYQAGDMCSPSVRITISGSGDATVCATETLDSTISGSGSIGYYGQPAINSSGSGSGTINSLGQK